MPQARLSSLPGIKLGRLRGRRPGAGEKTICNRTRSRSETISHGTALRGYLLRLHQELGTAARHVHNLPPWCQTYVREHFIVTGDSPRSCARLPTCISPSPKELVAGPFICLAKVLDAEEPDLVVFNQLDGQGNASPIHESCVRKPR